MKTCLIIVDLQNDYFEGGNMALVNIAPAAANARQLLDSFRRSQWPVIHVQHINRRPGATFFLPDTPGAAIHEQVSPLAGEIRITKHFPNSFRDTDLLQRLQALKAERLIICGAMSHMCIDATTRAAFDHGYQCVVAEDACATRDLVFRERTVKAADVHAAFMAALAMPYAQVLPTAQILETTVGP